MSFINGLEPNRQIIPRWHTFSVARLLGNLNAFNTTPLTSMDLGYHQQRVENWLKHKKISFAIDLVGSALIINDLSNPIVIEAARYILKNEKTSSKLALEIANNFLFSAGEFDQKSDLYLEEQVNIPLEVRQYHACISRLKSELKKYPKDPINWIDLAFYYTVLGQRNRAEHSVRAALSLSSNNRFVLRSAARFFIHFKRADEALYLLRKTDISRIDPWIIASEISISESQNEKSKLIKTGRCLINDTNYSPFHLSELLGSLGTLEINYGSLKKGKKLLRSALVEPTENTLAQVASFNSLMEIPEITSIQGKIIDSFEAGARIYFREGQYRKALECTREWSSYQPFSVIPAILGSYIAGITLGEHREAIKFCKLGKLSSPKNFTLNNNLAFSLASIEKIEEAEKILKEIDSKNLTEHQQNVYKATKGLIEFRRKNYTEARTLYSEAINAFKELKDEKAFWLANLYWLREEKRIKNPDAQSHLNFITERIERTDMNDIKALAKAISQYEIVQ